MRLCGDWLEMQNRPAAKLTLMCKGVSSVGLSKTAKSTKQDWSRTGIAMTENAAMIPGIFERERPVSGSLC